MKKLVLPTLVLLLSTQLMAQSELKTTSISIFKNGKSFVVKEGSVTTSDNIYTLSKIPNALFGTLWFTGLQADVEQVASKLEQVDEPIERKASSFTDLLYANKGKQLTITTNDDKVYSGVVEDYDLPEEVNSYLQLKEAELSEKYGDIYNATFRLFPPETPVLLMKVSGKWVSIAPSSIKSIEFSEKPERTAKLKVKVKKPLVKVKFAKGGDQQLAMMYLQNGISWTPTYLLELQSDTEATLKMQAEVANNAEDIVSTNLNFIVGVPNFKFANNPATLISFANQVAQQTFNYKGDGRFGNNMIMTQMAGDYAYSEARDESSIVANVDAESSEDLYFYNISNVTLEKGGRAHYPIFNVPVKIKHLYECNLSVQNEQAYHNADSETGLSFDVKYCNVFHTIRISNDTKNPFTTGSVMIVDKAHRPLSEDLIKYTGVGQTSSIQLTQSPDIRIEEQEKIINVQPQAKKYNGYSYKLLTIQGEVTISNSKKQSIELQISKQLSGKSKSATVKYDSKQMPAGSSSVNPIDRLKFDLSVEAGKTQKFTYIYEMYVYD